MDGRFQNKSKIHSVWIGISISNILDCSHDRLSRQFCCYHLIQGVSDSIVCIITKRSWWWLGSSSWSLFWRNARCQNASRRRWTRWTRVCWLDVNQSHQPNNLHLITTQLSSNTHRKIDNNSICRNHEWFSLLCHLRVFTKTRRNNGFWDALDFNIVAIDSQLQCMILYDPTVRAFTISAS